MKISSKIANLRFKIFIDREIKLHNYEIFEMHSTKFIIEIWVQFMTRLYLRNKVNMLCSNDSLKIAKEL